MKETYLLVDKKGIALITAVLIMMVFMAIGTVFISMMSTDLKIASNQRRSAQALWIAEAGLQRALWELDQDFEDDQGWADGDINGNSVEDGTPSDSWPADTAFHAFLEDTLTVGGQTGKYTLQVKYNYSSGEGVTPVIYHQDKIVVRSIGTLRGAKRVIEASLKVREGGGGVDPGAVFSGSPLNGGGAIMGNVTFRGSLYIRGTATIDAVVLSGNAGIFNNYEKDGVLGSAISSYLKARIPGIYDSELGMNTLDARLFIYQGNLNLGGNSYAGKSQILTSDRQPLNGIYVGGTTSGESHVFADTEELSNADVPDIPFPGMLDWFQINDDPNDVVHYKGLYPGYTDTQLALKMYEDAARDLDYYSGGSDPLEGIYLAPEVLDDSDPPQALNAGTDPPFQGIDNSDPADGIIDYYKLVINKDTRSFSVTKDSSKIEWNKDSKVLTFTGSPLIYVEKDLSNTGDNVLELANGAGNIADNKIQYGGVATLVVEGDVEMGQGVAAYDNGTGQHRFPHNSCLNVLTDKKINFTATNGADFTGYFYAEGEVYFSKQVKIAGALVSNLITYANVPDVYEVPELFYALPPGIPGGPGTGPGDGSGTGAWTIVFREVEGKIQPWREVY